jgi:hypothetical protein
LVLGILRPQDEVRVWRLKEIARPALWVPSGPSSGPSRRSAPSPAAFITRVTRPVHLLHLRHQTLLLHEGKGYSYTDHYTAAVIVLAFFARLGLWVFGLWRQDEQEEAQAFLARFW